MMQLCSSVAALSLDYFETVVKESNNQAKISVNWVMGEFSAALNKANLEITESPVSANQLGKLVLRIADNTISGKIAKTIFEAIGITKVMLIKSLNNGD